MVCKVFNFLSNLVVAIFLILLLLTICECFGEYKKWAVKQRINRQIMDAADIEQNLRNIEINSGSKSHSGDTPLNCILQL